jgi:hypothetical protein
MQMSVAAANDDMVDVAGGGGMPHNPVAAASCRLKSSSDRVIGSIKPQKQHRRLHRLCCSPCSRMSCDEV